METVTFYSWIEQQPSSLIIRISGGHMARYGENQKTRIVSQLKEVRFNKGILHSSDPETIETLDRLAANGESITRDHALYLSKTLSDKEKAARSAKTAQSLEDENKKLRDENERLKKKFKNKRAEGGAK